MNLLRRPGRFRKEAGRVRAGHCGFGDGKEFGNVVDFRRESILEAGGRHNSTKRRMFPGETNLI
jgi:hypothetical protein